MKPILIVQHLNQGGVPLFDEVLQERGLKAQTVRPDLGESLPSNAELDRYSGLCFCGGTQSANDSDVWLRREIEMIRAAAQTAQPVIGHCLGGQLIAKALGGNVTLHTGEEYGWQKLTTTGSPLAGDWLGVHRRHWYAMQWHKDTFSVPEGAEQILFGDHCHPQAFVWNNMLAMQFHVELVEGSVRHWAVDLAHEAPPAGVMAQAPQQILSDLPHCMPISLQLGRSLYTHWLDKLS